MKRFFYLTITGLVLLLTNIMPAGAQTGGFFAEEDSAIPFTAPAGGIYGLDVECAAEAVQLYFIWDEAPGEWTLTAVDASGTETVYACGEYNFLHEYIRLDSPSAKLNFMFSYRGKTAVTGKVYAFGEGEPPNWVEQWEPPCEKADLLVLPEQPGDEYLYFGGTLPYYADKRKKIQVAYALSEGESPGQHEILSALYGVGVRNYPVMENTQDKTDGGTPVYFYIEQIRRFKPEVVLGRYTGENQGIAAAIDASGGEEYGAWEIPATYLHGFGSGETVIDWHVALDTLDGKTATEAAWEAYFSLFPESPKTNERGFIRLYNSDRFGLYRAETGSSLPDGFFEDTIHSAPPVPTPDSSAPASLAEPESAASDESSAETDTRQDESGRNSGFLPILAVSAVLCFVCAILLRDKRGG